MFLKCAAFSIYFIVASLSGPCSFGQTSNSGCLTILVQGIKKDHGIVRLMLYDDASKFLVDRGSCRAVTVSADKNSAGTVSFEINDLPYGHYAAAVYHDMNGNGHFDMNRINVPVEPYGFCHEVRSKWTMPTFSKVKFEINQSCVEYSTTVRHWSAQ